MPCWQLSQSAQPVFEINFVMEKKQSFKFIQLDLALVLIMQMYTIWKFWLDHPYKYTVSGWYGRTVLVHMPKWQLSPSACPIFEITVVVEEEEVSKIKLRGVILETSPSADQVWKVLEK